MFPSLSTPQELLRLVTAARNEMQQRRHEENAASLQTEGKPEHFLGCAQRWEQDDPQAETQPNRGRRPPPCRLQVSGVFPSLPSSPLAATLAVVPLLGADYACRQTLLSFYFFCFFSSSLCRCGISQLLLGPSSSAARPIHTVTGVAVLHEFLHLLVHVLPALPRWQASFRM